MSEKIKLNPNHLLARMNELLAERPDGWFKAVGVLGERLTKYLRGDGPDPDWERFPIARSHYTQSN